jgi:hypothetical protein
MEQNPSPGLAPSPPSNNEPPLAGGVKPTETPPAGIQPAAPSSPPGGQPQVILPSFIDQNVERPLGVAGPAEPTPVAGQVIGFNDAAQDPPSRSFIRNKKILIPVLALFILLGGGAAAYFGYYVPNKPANVWKTALTRTGMGYDKLSDYAVGQFQSKDSGIKLDGNFKTSGVFAADGTFSGSSDKDNGEFKGSLSVSGLKIDGELRLIKSAASTPDVYFKMNGLQGLGDLLGGFGVPPDYVSSINGLNGKWYFVDHSLFNQLSGSDSSSLQITSDDVKSVLKAVGDAGKQNIFTNDPSKMTFIVKTEVGKEKRDGRNVYHYVAAVDKDNLKNYVTALCDNLKKSNLKKFFNNDSQQVYDSIGCSTASDSVNNFDSSRTADVWVDLHTKLIHAVRITDPKKKTNYFEIGQDYQGGSKFPFDLKFHSEDEAETDDAGISLALDTKSNTFSLGGSLKEKSKTGDDTNLNASFQLNVSPNSAKVNVQKPAGAENILQLLNDLGFGQIYQQGVQSQAKDTERKTDINAMEGHIEAYWADNGVYPTLANLNDPAWRAVNTKGLDAEAFKDPDGSSGSLAAAPAPHVYAYQPVPAGCNNTSLQCAGYTLTATLDSGGTYVKHDLNSDTAAPVYQN